MKQKIFIYQKIALHIEEQIMNGILKFGEKLPSIRILQQEYGISMSTVLQAYYALEAKSLIEARPRSGYYVVFSEKHTLKSPEKTRPNDAPSIENKTDLIIDLFHNLNDKEMVNFSLVAPSKELLPIVRFNSSNLIRGGKISPVLHFNF